MRSYMQYEEWSYWPLNRIRNRYFVQLATIYLEEGQQLLPVIDITDIIRQVQQGVVNENGSDGFGPSECLLHMGEEGGSGSIRRKDGGEILVQIAYITVNILISTPTLDELYNPGNTTEGAL